MITDRFSALLEELSPHIQIDLKPDANNCCLIRFQDGVQLTLQPSNTESILYIAIEIGSVPKGRYRETIFKEALKANGLPQSRRSNGIFCYSSIKDMLLIYDTLPLEEMNGIRLFEIMSLMLEKTRVWKSALDRGEVPSFRSYELTFKLGNSRSNLFGLR